MADIHIREIDPAFYKALKVRAAENGQTLKDYVLEALKIHSLPVLEKQTQNRGTK